MNDTTKTRKSTVRARQLALALPALILSALGAKPAAAADEPWTLLLENRTGRTLAQFEMVETDEGHRKYGARGDVSIAHGPDVPAGKTVPVRNAFDGMYRVVVAALNPQATALVQRELEVKGPTSFVFYEGAAPHVSAPAGYTVVKIPIDTIESGATFLRLTNASKQPICQVHAAIKGKAPQLDVHLGKALPNSQYEAPVNGEQIAPGKSALFRVSEPGTYRVRVVNCDRTAWLAHLEDVTVATPGLELVLGDKGARPVGGLPARTVAVKPQKCVSVRLSGQVSPCVNVNDDYLRQLCEIEHPPKSVSMGNFTDCEDL